MERQDTSTMNCDVDSSVSGMPKPSLKAINFHHKAPIENISNSIDIFINSISIVYCLDIAIKKFNIVV